MATVGLTAVRLVLIAAGVGLLGLAALVRARQNGPAIRPFVVLLAVVGLLSVADGVVAPNQDALALVWTTAYLTIPVAFAAFVVEYYGLPYLATRARKAAFVLPAVVGAAGGYFIVLSPSMGGVMNGGTMTGTPAYPVAVAQAADIANSMGIFYAGFVMLGAVALLWRTCSRYAHLDTKLGVALAFVGVWPWASYLTTPVTFGSMPLPTILGLSATGYVASALAAGFVVSTGRLFEATPAAGILGPETVLDEFADPVLVVDREGRLVRHNDAAARTFDAATPDSVGRPLAEVVGASPETLAAGDCLELSVTDGSRQFEPTVTDVTDRHGRTPGRAVVLRDVTRERLRRQRLTVLNRVLRHNLRNSMTSIIGRAQLLGQDDPAAEPAALADGILTSADDLVALGNRVREIENLMSVTPAVDAETDLARVVDTVVDGVAEDHPDAEFSVAVDDELVAAVDERVLEPVLGNVVENAVEHNDTDRPQVTVTATAPAGDAESVEVEVADDGPGIPESERTVLEDGDEGPLEHGSGLGLWAVSWGVTRMGGELTFAENEPRGTVVTIRLPRAVPAAAETGSVASPVDAD